MLSLLDLTPAQLAFVESVCAGLRRTDKAAQSVYGDGTNRTDGWKFAADRTPHSWRIVFDFCAGRCLHWSVELPRDWDYLPQAAA